MLKIIQTFLGIFTFMGITYFGLQNFQNQKKFETPNETLIYQSFYNWKSKNQKQYSSIENENKFQIYKQNYLFIKKHNIENKNFQLSLNEYSEHDSKDFIQKYTGFKQSQNQTQIKILEKNDILTSLDWSKKGAVTQVKNQGSCGSSWAFSTIGALEGLYFIQNQDLKEFSEQQLIDCTNQFGNNGCNGGSIDAAFQYIKNQGVVYDSDYPYNQFQNQCINSQKKQNFKVFLFIQIGGYNNVPQNSNQQLLLALQKGPLSAAIDASCLIFQFYKSGIFDKDCGKNLNHAVLIVGYGEENGQKYYIIKNSWGVSWGEQGYIRIKRYDRDDEGICGILQSASYPIEQKIVTI